jgi:hypothetical protein
MFDAIVDVTKVGDDVLEREYSRLAFWRNLTHTFLGGLSFVAPFIFFGTIIALSLGDSHRWQLLTVCAPFTLFLVGSVYTLKKAASASLPIEEECFRRARYQALAGVHCIIDRKIYDGSNAVVVWQRVGSKTVSQTCKTDSGNWFEFTFTVSAGQIASEIQSIKPLSEAEARKAAEDNPEIYFKVFGIPEIA